MKNFEIKDGILIRYHGTDEVVTIPHGVTAINIYAFGCKSVEKINIPNSVIDIHNRAFLNCKNLSNIYVDKNNPKYTDIDGVLFTKSKDTLICYPSGRTETEYTIPYGVNYIGNYAFGKCRNLEKIILPDGVIQIYKGVFWNCKNLKDINIPNSVTTIGIDAFRGCENLKIEIPNSVKIIEKHKIEDFLD